MRTQSEKLWSLVHKLSLHTDLSADDKTAILALPHIEKILEAGRYVMREGDKATSCCLVISGFAIRNKVAGDGGRQIVNIHVPGDMVDLQNSFLAVADHNVQALTNMQGAFIPRAAMTELAFAYPTVGKALWLETLIEGSISREWIMNVGRRNALTRVAHLLCEFAYRLGAVGGDPDAECTYDLPMTQEQLADTVGLTPIHMNRTLKALESDGLIMRKRRSVLIADLPKLARAGDFKSLYLHLPPRALPAHHGGAEAFA